MNFGHMIIGMILGLKIKSLHINAFGLSVLFETYESKKIIELKKIAIAIAGPMVNILFIIIANFLNINLDLKQTIIYANALIAIFNLLPIYPLDGGRILKAILNMKFKERITEKTVNNISNALVIMLTIISSVLVLYLKNLAIVFVIAYLWIITIKENKKYALKERMYKIIEKEKF